MSITFGPHAADRGPVADARLGAGARGWPWFVAGAALLPFTLFQTALPVAAWLAPVFLLRFARTRRARVALPLIALAGYIGWLIGLRDILPLPMTALYGLGGLTIAVPYAADLLLARRLRGAVRTLVFPLAYVTLNFLMVNDATGTLGVAAYTQAVDLPLLQVVSLGGIWGLSFLIAWLAPVTNDLWERGFDLRQARASVGLFAGVLLAALLFGGARLAFFAPSAPTVQVAALAPDRELDEALSAAAADGLPTDSAGRAAFHERHMAPLLDDLFARTREAAGGGAKIVVWAEAAGFAFKEGEVALIERAQAVARDEQVYLQLGLVLFLPPGSSAANENRALLIDPSGAILWDYHKTKVVMSDGNAPGPGVVPTVDTPYGRLATVICFDADFPALVHQAGRAGADILLVPASDWAPVAELHSRAAIFRAVENGAALVRPTRMGTSLAVDHQGRLLGYKADYFVGDGQTMVASVPTDGAVTLYGRIGEGFAYLCVAGLAALAGLALVRRGPVRSSTTEPTLAG